MKRYPIFLDKEIGIPDTYQNTIRDIVLMVLVREQMRTTIVLKRSWPTASSNVSTSWTPMGRSWLPASVFRSRKSSIPSRQSRPSTPGPAPSLSDTRTRRHQPNDIRVVISKGKSRIDQYLKELLSLRSRSLICRFRRYIYLYWLSSLGRSMIMERVRTVGTAGKSITFYFSF